MNARAPVAIVGVVGVVVGLGVDVAAADAPWKHIGNERGVDVSQRERADITETRGVGVVDAPPLVVKRALDDYEAKDGAMPYLSEMRVLKRDQRGALIYHRTSPPLIRDRDYTIRMFDETEPRSDGTIAYVLRWRTANDEGPPPTEGVVRVAVTEGSWRLEPVDGGTRTRATYTAAASAGGDVPQSLADWATSLVVGDIFEALRTRVKNPKYRT